MEESKTNYKFYFGLLLLIAICVELCGAKADTQNQFGDFAQPSLKRDTLYLLECAPESESIFSIWTRDPNWNGNNPAIRMVSKSKLNSLKERYYNYQQQTKK